MKRHAIPVVSLLFAAVLPCSQLSAQQIVPFVGGGLAIGMGDVGEGSDPGFLVLGGFDVPLPVVTDGFGFGVSAAYANIPYKSDPSSGDFDEAMQITSITAEISYLIGAPTSALRGFVRGGGGVQIHHYDPGNLVAGSSTNTMPGFTAGLGINYSLGAANLLLGGRLSMAEEGGFAGGYAGIAIPVGP